MLYLLLDHEGYLPSYALVTPGNVAEVKVAQGLQVEPGTIVIGDRGYNDYGLFGKWISRGSIWSHG